MITGDLNLDANVTLLGIIFNTDGTLNSNTSDITIPPFVGTSIANSTAVFTFTVAGLVSCRPSAAACRLYKMPSTVHAGQCCSWAEVCGEHAQP